MDLFGVIYCWFRIYIIVFHFLFTYFKCNQTQYQKVGIIKQLQFELRSFYLLYSGLLLRNLHTHPSLKVKYLYTFLGLLADQV